MKLRDVELFVPDVMLLGERVSSPSDPRGSQERRRFDAPLFRGTDY
jgi:hypothetical protein